ncbi:MAG: hypothetical protein HS111_31145 [Kofleriaceae bacterium]|nr:hypothetical protein [Kofleriaceae bacterium]
MRHLNYVYGAGAKGTRGAQGLGRPSPRLGGGAGGVRGDPGQDPHHLDARWVLARALAQAGDSAAAVEHLAAALAGDWLRWGPTLDNDPELAGSCPRPRPGPGRAEQEARRRLRRAGQAGPLVLARRSTFKMPGVGTNPGVDARRALRPRRRGPALRITHTDHQLAAWVRSPGGDELLLVGFDRVERPDPKKARTRRPSSPGRG